MLHPHVAFFQRAVDPELDNKRFCLELFLAGQLFGSFGEDVIQALFQAFSLDALPFFVVVGTQEDGVFARDDRGSLRQRDHFVLHDALDLAGDLDDEFLGLAAWFDLGVARGVLEDAFAAVTIDPTSDFFQNAQAMVTSHVLVVIDVNIFSIEPSARCRIGRYPNSPLLNHINLIPVILRIYNFHF